MRALPFAFGVALALAGCGEKERPPPLEIPSGGASSDPDDDGEKEECIELPELDTSSLCGSEVVPIIAQKPNLYFVLDLSGSMADRIPGELTMKLTAAQNSILSVVGSLGHRIRYGLGVFPGPTEEDDLAGCSAGYEAFETQEGDPLRCVNLPPDGPVLQAFTRTVRRLRASGGTPLSASLAAITPILRGLEGPTAVLLMTDGAPNCNPDALCGIEECTLNWYRTVTPGGACNAELNCCDPTLSEQTNIPEPGNWCVDSDASLAEVETLRSLGIMTYVVGVPGSDLFTDLMNRLAEAGGTARAGDTAYYDVQDVAELEDTLRRIGAQVARSCEIHLKETPKNPHLFNVYLDATLLAQNPKNGWTLEGTLVTLHGSACEDVRSGRVSQIQMVSGCETVIR